MALSPKPETLKVTIEIDNADGSKTIVKTTELTAGGISRNLAEDPDHFLIEMVDPTYESGSFDSWYRTFRHNHDPRVLLPLKEFFSLNIQLPKAACSNDHFVYTVQHIEKPTNQMVLSYMPHSHIVSTTTMTVDEAAEHIDSHSTQRIYFVVEVPE